MQQDEVTQYAEAVVQESLVQARKTGKPLHQLIVTHSHDYAQNPQDCQAIWEEALRRVHCER